MGSYVVTAIDCNNKARCFGSTDIRAAVNSYTDECQRGLAEDINADGTHVVFVSLESFDDRGVPVNSLNTKEALECEHTRRSDVATASSTAQGGG